MTKKIIMRLDNIKCPEEFKKEWDEFMRKSNKDK